MQTQTNTNLPAVLPRPKTLPEPYEDLEEQIEEPLGEGWRVLLFNDDVHSMDEVIFQIIKATDCPLDAAEAIMRRAHRQGRATVTIADQEEANRVADILREIALQVSVDRV